MANRASKTKKHILFLSHSERDRALAKALKLGLARSLGIADSRVFLSSDRSIQAGAQPFQSITRALKQVDGVVVLLTPNSLRSPWVHFEAGAAVSTNMFVVSACGIDSASLPPDLFYHTVKNLRTAPVVRQFLQDVAAKLDRKFKSPSPSVVGAITRYANIGHDGWKLVLPAMVADGIDGSPFELHKLLQHASKSAFIIGQNLHGMTCGAYSATAEKAVFAFLRRKGTVKMLIQEPGPVVDAWSKLNPSAKGDFEKSIPVLQKWLRKANQLRINSAGRQRLDIRMAPLVPVSFDIVDADLPTGVMAFRHALHRAPRTEDRPSFALQGGKNNPVFRHLLGCWNQAFNDAKALWRNDD